MPRSAPDARATRRLRELLDAYDRTELWLRIRRYYRLLDQPDQVWVEVVDAQGKALPDRFGRVQTHTLQVPADWRTVVAGHLVHLQRVGDGVRMQRRPVPPGRLLDLPDAVPLDQVGT